MPSLARSMRLLRREPAGRASRGPAATRAAVSTFAILSVALAGAGSARGQSPADELPPITVTGRPSGEAQRLNSEIPQTRIDATTIERRPDARASDTLGRMPGVVLGGPPGEKKSINLRGIAGDFNRTQINGVQLPTSSQTRSFEVMNLPSFLLGDVTIIRNPSAEYEGDGIAGRIALTTRPIPDTFTVEGSAGIGGAGSVRGSHLDGQIATLGMGGKVNDRFGMLGAVAFDRRTITKEKDYSERTYSGGPGGQGFLRDETEPKRFTNLDAMLDFGLFTDGGEIHLRPMLLREWTILDKVRDQYRRVTGQFQDRTLTSGTERTDTTGSVLSVKHAFGNGVTVNANAGIVWSRFDSRNSERSFNNLLAFSSGAAETSALRDRTLLMDASVAIPFDLGDSHELKVGVAARRATRTSDRQVYTLSSTGVASQTPANATASAESDYRIAETYLAGFVQTRLRIGSRFVATPGVRIEHVADRLRGGTGSASPSFTDILPSLPVLFRLTESTSLRAAVSRQVNRPKFDEIAPGITRRGPRLFNGNPALRPARSWSVDAGADYGTSYLFVSVNGFHRAVRDLIESQETAPNQYVFRNVGNGRLYGLELEQRVAMGLFGWKDLAPLTVFANQTFIGSRVRDPATGPRRFVEQPSFVGNLGVEWNDTARGTRIVVVGNYTSMRQIISNEGGTSIRKKNIRSQFFLDVQVEQQVARGFSLFLRAENLTNQKRDEIEWVDGTLNRDAVIGTGRTLYVGGKVSF